MEAVRGKKSVAPSIVGGEGQGQWRGDIAGLWGFSKDDRVRGALVAQVTRGGSGRRRCLTQGGSGDDKRKVPGTKKKKIRNYGGNRTNSSPGTEGRGNSKMPPIPTKNEQNFNGVNAVKRRD